MFDSPNTSVPLFSADSASLNTEYISDLAERSGSRREPSVLILTSQYDVDADFLQLYLNAEGIYSSRFNCECGPSQRLSFLYGDGSIRACLRNDDGRVLPLDPKIVIYRHFQNIPFLGVAENGPELFQAIQRSQLANCLEEHFCRARWINPPRAAARCRNRLHQLNAAHNSGLVTPDTLITNDRREAESFLAKHKLVIAKAIGHHGVRSETTLHNFYGRLVNAPNELGATSRDNPILLQRYLPKIAEVRAYVFGESVIAIRIEATACSGIPIDMHTMPLDSYSYAECNLSPVISQRCRDLVAALDLSYAAIDLVEGLDGTLSFLEVNPAGDWAWIDSQVHLELTAIFAKRIANYLS
jgi:glutathione synthase/RimK-type ligase-like ATP-grasp enzyme